MTVEHPPALADRVRRHLAEIGPSHTVTGLGFSPGEEHRFAEDLVALREGPWCFLDLRSADVPTARHRLEEAWDEEAVVAMVRPGAVASPVLALVAAMAEGRLEVDLGGVELLVRRADQSVVLLVEGADARATLPPLLAQVMGTR
jgi:hypothetical protein